MQTPISRSKTATRPLTLPLVEDTIKGLPYQFDGNIVPSNSPLSEIQALLNKFIHSIPAMSFYSGHLVGKLLTFVFPGNGLSDFSLPCGIILTKTDSLSTDATSSKKVIMGWQT